MPFLPMLLPISNIPGFYGPTFQLFVIQSEFLPGVILDPIPLT
jgi:hypothetical protein